MTTCHLETSPQLPSPQIDPIKKRGNTILRILFSVPIKNVMEYGMAVVLKYICPYELISVSTIIIVFPLPWVSTKASPSSGDWTFPARWSKAPGSSVGSCQSPERATWLSDWQSSVGQSGSAIDPYYCYIYIYLFIFMSSTFHSFTSAFEGTYRVNICGLFDFVYSCMQVKKHSRKYVFQICDVFRSSHRPPLVWKPFQSPSWTFGQLPCQHIPRKT